MHIKTITVSGLFGRQNPVVLSLYDDLNIMTGRNGSGKTTIMKLAWFIMSGNILLALREINFKICALETSEYTCTVIRTGSMHCKVELDVKGDRTLFEDDEGDPEDEPFLEAAEDKANPVLMAIGGSIFFPTFRRIEGGFSMASGRQRRNRSATRTESDVDESLATFARKLTKQNHLFVSAISTQDIVSLLLQRYATFSEEINAYQGNVSRNVIEKIKHYQQGDGHKQQNADDLLSETRADIEKIETFRTETMKPLDAVKDLVKKLFQHSGILFDKRLSFGDAAEAINSEALSAGEKQMLSFICYNAFYKNAIIFIDEPELSLHVDWQRQLYQILNEQRSGNQFIFATHSPFIYGKYPDKEVSVGVDRGE
ncbi:AAA family ATPase (plasmid) [Lichenicola cladoniae]|uniref:AAA family ATPase n=1 Tax=Lichenicola cladoniae TaxID=1484109 RepID=A0A6M8I0A4_9PROT|nr:ATP-binding protein [Lichenicola cladoniae]NPD69790.1 AAA family ATPase [Acetobacteraceae bacterium]QKE94022.1 AAA family ATPase [Lichenicola cladoniae]